MKGSQHSELADAVTYGKSGGGGILGLDSWFQFWISPIARHLKWNVQQAIEARGLDPGSSHSYTLDLHNVTADDGKPDKISRKGLEGKGADGRELIPGNPPLSWDRMNQGSYCPRRRAICQISLILWTSRRKRFGGKKVCGGRESCKTISKVTEIMRTEFLVRSWF